MKIAFYKKASFWNLVIQSGQILLGTFQGVSLAVEKDVMDVNIVFAGIQAGLGIISLWTKDANRNNVIDIAEETTETTITVESKGPVIVKDVETKPTEQ
jgi:hypothetical protein